MIATQRSFVFLRILRFCNRLCDLLFSSSNQRVQNCLKSTRTVLGTYVYLLYNYATLVQGRPKKQTLKLVQCSVLGTYRYLIYNSPTLVQEKPKKQTLKLCTMLVKSLDTLYFLDLIQDISKLVVSDLIILNIFAVSQGKFKLLSTSYQTWSMENQYLCLQKIIELHREALFF